MWGRIYVFNTTKHFSILLPDQWALSIQAVGPKELTVLYSSPEAYWLTSTGSVFCYLRRSIETRATNAPCGRRGNWNSSILNVSIFPSLVSNWLYCSHPIESIHPASVYPLPDMWDKTHWPCNLHTWPATGNFNMKLPELVWAINTLVAFIVIHCTAEDTSGLRYGAGMAYYCHMPGLSYVSREIS